MSTVNALMTDKKRTERSNVSASTAFNDAKLRKSPSAQFPRDSSIVSGPTNAASGGSSATGGAKSPRGKMILPSSISKLAQSQPMSQQQLPQQVSTSDPKQISPPQASGGNVEAALPPPADPPVTLRPDLGMKIEFVLGLLSAGILLGLWIYLMTTDCFEKPDMIFWVKTFAILGCVAGLFIAIYCCFERSLSPARGFAACLYISFLAMVGGLNLVGAYVATTCICSCRDNALRDAAKKDDLIIFILELLGAVCILGVILVASLTRPMV